MKYFRENIEIACCSIFFLNVWTLKASKHKVVLILVFGEKKKELTNQTQGRHIQYIIMRKQNEKSSIFWLGNHDNKIKIYH